MERKTVRFAFVREFEACILHYKTNDYICILLKLRQVLYLTKIKMEGGTKFDQI